MSLDYDLNKIVNRDKSDEGWETTVSIIFGCMITEIGTITADNADEWYARFKIINPSTSIKLRDVINHVGLTTNVINRSRHYWQGSVLAHHMDSIMIDARRAYEQTEEINELLSQSTQDRLYATARVCRVCRQTITDDGCGC